MVTALEVRGLRKHYGPVVALGGVDLAVERGEVMGLLGPNGAGKTTFTKCVTGFVRPEAGDIQVMHVDARAEPTRAAQYIGLVPDQYDFYSNLTARQHLEFYGRLLGMPPEPRQARVQEVIELVGMTERADDRTKGYSHGMKQRICIAQAILHGPEVLLLDEPTNGLDPKAAYELRQMVKELARGGTAVVLNSHLLSEVEETCERVAVLDRGQLLVVERVDDLRRRFAHGVKVRVRVANPSASLRRTLEKTVGAVDMEGGNTYLFMAPDEHVAEAVAAIVEAGGMVTEVVPGRASLESVFLQITEEVT